jgi:hypothetical protein
MEKTSPQVLQTEVNPSAPTTKQRVGRQSPAGVGEFREDLQIRSDDQLSIAVCHWLTQRVTLSA